MRNETANLKAERELWKNIEKRLTEDNRSLVDERSRLNKMISDLQSLQNEREHADSENRRKLQSRIETLESEYSAAKRRLDEEVDQSRKAALRREYEQEQNRTRIEDLLKGSSNAKEELVAAKTQRDQLQARVDEMKIELRNAEEKAQALQPRPSTRPNNSTETDENALTREQEMGIEIADLTRDLQLKQS
jgi:nucleoprotein TPR